MSCNPIIEVGMSDCLEGNVNGPSLIKVPDWLPNRLGNYYLYFAHHKGAHIRLAYADRIEGPWQIHQSGTLHLVETPCARNIASPDVHVDEPNRRLLMYYHGPTPVKEIGQRTFLATSLDGLHFDSDDVDLAPYYLRVFEYDGIFYGIAKSGNTAGCLLRSESAEKPFEVMREIFPRMRHAAVRKEGAELTIFFSRVWESPECILVSRLSLEGPAEGWDPSDPETLLAPETDYEGGDLEVVESRPSIIAERVRALRDPAYYREGGRQYLIYSIAGEWGIAVAELVG